MPINCPADYKCRCLLFFYQDVYKRQIQATRIVGLKLTAAQVKQIKKIIGDPKRKLTMKKLAARYGVSEMTLYRIKSGENWSRI